VSPNYHRGGTNLAPRWASVNGSRPTLLIFLTLDYRWFAGYKNCMALRPRAALVPLLLLAAACDDYYEGPPPATPVEVNQPDPAAAAAQPQTVEPQGDNYADTDPSALTDFHGTLDAHGRWVEDPVYGTVWAPNPTEVGADFSPYETAGHWVYDDDDYVWVSDYDWGWAPFHYGRWVLTDGGWVWIPGRVYAGAWVDWRFGYPGWAYVGWGPAYPTFIWRAGVPVGYVAVAPAAHFYYCAHGDIFAPSIGARIVTGPQVAGIAAHTGFYGAGGQIATAPPAGGSRHGPAPAAMGIAPQNVAHAPPGDRSLATAKGFAHPSTATQMGAHPPVRHMVKPAAQYKPRGGFRAPARGGGGFHGGHR
jgi:hypothetical protein